MWLNFTIEKKTFRNGGHGHEILGAFDGHIERGSFLAILGQSGVGKSTLLRIIAGLDLDYEGSVTLNNRRVVGPSKSVGLVFQDPRLLPWMSVWQNVEFALAVDMPKEQRHVRVLEVLRVVGLERRATAYPRELSGGMAKRVALARAIVEPPAVLLLDEPFAGLDLTSKIELISLVNKIHEENALTSIVVTHDLDEALLLADSIALMAGSPGKILGSTKSVNMPKPRDLTAIPYRNAREMLLRFLLARRADDLFLEQLEREAQWNDAAEKTEEHRLIRPSL